MIATGRQLVHADTAIRVHRTRHANVYLTDEVFLYRIAGLLVGRRSQVVELEDCYSLDVIRVSMNDLGERHLRVVRPSVTDRPGHTVAEGDHAIREFPAA